MGGKNPTLVLDDADLRVAAESVAKSAFFSTGQRFKMACHGAVSCDAA
ncbi:aldehyde dehydrogenase family protein [Pelagibacterium sp.]